MRHGYYVADGAWLSNLCRGFSYSWDPFSSKIESLRKKKKNLTIGEGEKKMAVRVKI